MKEARQVRSIILSNGVPMPLESFGVFRIPDGDDCERIVWEALKTGYRLIDTAAAYGNEDAVGRAIRKSGVPREEIFLATKLWVQDYGHALARRAIEISREKLGVDYIDLVLLHQPVGDVCGAWKALEEAYEDGRLRAIGVANFFAARLADFCEHAAIRPMVDQIEMHPFFAQEQTMQTMKEYEVAPQAWAPLAEGRHNLFHHPVLEGIGRRYGKTAAQVALRWNIERGVSVIPKSVHKARMEQNLDIWDFALSPGDRESIEALDLGRSEIVDHSDSAFIRQLSRWRIHA